jgi:hypothetical protein
LPKQETRRARLWTMGLRSTRSEQGSRLLLGHSPLTQVAKFALRWESPLQWQGSQKLMRWRLRAIEFCEAMGAISSSFRKVKGGSGRLNNLHHAKAQRRCGAVLLRRLCGDQIGSSNVGIWPVAPTRLQPGPVLSNDRSRKDTENPMIEVPRCRALPKLHRVTDTSHVSAPDAPLLPFRLSATGRSSACRLLCSAGHPTAPVAPPCPQLPACHLLHRTGIGRGDSSQRIRHIGSTLSKASLFCRAVSERVSRATQTRSKGFASRHRNPSRQVFRP